MTKGMLFGVIGAAVALVAVIAVLTPILIDDDGPSGTFVAAVSPPQLSPPRAAPGPPDGPGAIPSAPGRPFREFRGCIQQHGFGRLDRTPPVDPQELRKALQACRGKLPGTAPFGR